MNLKLGGQYLSNIRMSQLTISRPDIEKMNCLEEFCPGKGDRGLAMTPLAMTIAKGRGLSV